VFTVIDSRILRISITHSSKQDTPPEVGLASGDGQLSTAVLRQPSHVFEFADFSGVLRRLIQIETSHCFPLTLELSSRIVARYMLPEEFKSPSRVIRMNRSYSAPLFCILALTLAACSAGNQQQSQPTPPDQRATDESTIRGLDADWLKAVVAKDATLTTSFYADGASLFAPGAPLATGKEAIQKAWAGLMGTPGFALTFETTKIEVSRAGDLAYDLGEYQLTTNDKKGKPQTVRGKYVVVWGKQPGGAWKALVDAPTTTQ